MTRTKSSPPEKTAPPSAIGEWNQHGLRVAEDVRLGAGVKLFGFVNLYGCTIGDETRVGCFVEVQRGATVGARCKISSHSFICEGVTIEDEVFVGHGVTFINDRWPRATDGCGGILGDTGWKHQLTRVKRGASIGSGSTILGGVMIGENAMIGAGSVVTRDVPAHSTVAGNPARPVRRSPGASVEERGSPHPKPPPLAPNAETRTPTPTIPGT